MYIDWEKFISVESSWVPRLLTEHEIRKDSKVFLRIYSLKFSGQKYETSAFANFVISSIKKYVLSADDIANLIEKGEEPFLRARDYFGDIDPAADGKYGELILYLFTEAILKVPLIAFKIPTNSNDQVKGGDGIFCGNYNDRPAIFIGESKTWQKLNDALVDAFKSIDKLYKPDNPSPAIYEYFVAKKNLRRDLSKEELDYIYNCFSPGTTEYAERNKVHPILIVYDDERIKEINAEDQSDGEIKIKKLINEKIDDYLALIKSLVKKYAEVGEVNLDFFLVPLKSVEDFKKTLYRILHGSDWRPKSK